VQVTRACRAGRVNNYQQHEQRHQRMAEEQEVERHDEQLAPAPPVFLGTGRSTAHCLDFLYSQFSFSNLSTIGVMMIKHCALIY
jgi:hypothetical protein